jgi:hypothetical protein
MRYLSIRLFGFILLKKRAKTTQAASGLETKIIFFKCAADIAGNP